MSGELLLWEGVFLVGIFIPVAFSLIIMTVLAARFTANEVSCKRQLADIFTRGAWWFSPLAIIYIIAGSSGKAPIWVYALECSLGSAAYYGIARMLRHILIRRISNSEKGT